MRINPREAELLYVGDPMCSWCWGFAPVLDAVRREFLPRLGFRLMMGGLRPGAVAAPLDDALKGRLREHWQAVEAQTGQPFAWQFLEQDGFLYDTEPAARAVVAVRQFAPEREYDFFRAVQEAFYARGEDITRTAILAATAAAVGLNRVRFLAVYRADTTLSLTYEDFRAAQKMEVQGFPTLLLRLGDKLYPVTRGYCAYDRLEPLLRGLLQGDIRIWPPRFVVRQKPRC
jgi:putative protein-disulfide isomerase